MLPRNVLLSVETAKPGAAGWCCLLVTPVVSPMRRPPRFSTHSADVLLERASFQGRGIPAPLLWPGPVPLIRRHANVRWQRWFMTVRGFDLPNETCRLILLPLKLKFGISGKENRLRRTADTKAHLYLESTAGLFVLKAEKSPD